MRAQYSYAHLVMRGRSPCRRSRGTLRAPPPQPAAHHHILRIGNQQWSRRAAIAIPAFPWYDRLLQVHNIRALTWLFHLHAHNTMIMMMMMPFNCSTNPLSRHLPVTSVRSCAQSTALQLESGFQWAFPRAYTLNEQRTLTVVILQCCNSTMSESRLEVLEHLLWCAVALRGSHPKLREVVS